MKVVLLAESFLPHMNGVTHSLLQVVRHLERRGHDALVVAPRSGPIDRTLYGAEPVLLPSMPLPSYPDVRVTLASTNKLATILRGHDADVVHLASPFVLGWRGVLAAEAVGIPSVAVYQTDIPSYAERYGIPGAAPALTRHLGRLHRRADLTLAPSTSALNRLGSLGVDRLALWRRGVDTERFAPERRSEAWRRAVAPNGEIIVGYVGRLAPEKQVEDLRAIADLPGVRLVIVGDGPDRPALERMLPAAHFAGFLGGDDLAAAMAGFDVFVHPGESETFCQTIQEAMASGVPVVATGAGGPLDLVRSSVDGWLYRPGDLAELRSRVLDLTGDDAKRRAFAVRAREAVAGRGWERLGDELIEHYETVATGLPRQPRRVQSAGRRCRHDPGASGGGPARAASRPEGSLSRSAALAAELALVVDRAVRLVGPAAAVEVRLALALLRGLVLALECLAELALRLVGRARRLLFVGRHGFESATDAAARRRGGARGARARDIRRSQAKMRPLLGLEVARTGSRWRPPENEHPWSRPAGSWSPVVDPQLDWWTSTGDQRERNALMRSVIACSCSFE